jgi:hypothetical protein
MEHRCGTRHSLPAVVTLYPRFGGALRALVRDISISGMFVELDSGRGTMPMQSLVEIELPKATTGGRCTRCLAMVARATQGGLGLMFDRLGPPAVTRLLAGATAEPVARPKLRAVPSTSVEEPPRLGR